MVPARIVYRAPIVLAEFSAPWLSHPSERRSIGHDEDAAVASLGPSWSAELTQDLPIEPSAASALPRRKRLKPFKPKGFKKVALTGIDRLQRRLTVVCSGWFEVGTKAA